MKLKKLVRSIILSGLVAVSSSCGAPGGVLQGTPPPDKREQSVKSDAFNPKIDILFVIDNSGSMDSHQTRLASNVNLFTAEIFKTAFMDFHIGVTSTTVGLGSGKGSNGTLNGTPAVIDRNTPNGSAELARNMLLGTGGSGQEMSFDPVYLALTPPAVNAQNAGFYRPEAYLAVIFITDAEDQSTKMNAQTLHQALVNFKGGQAEKVLAYGVIVPHDDATNCPRDESGVKPIKIEDFIGKTKGKYYSLCDVDYGTKLAALAADIVMKAGRYMLLRGIPKPETIQVKFGTQILPRDANTGWTYEPAKNAIVLGDNIVWTKQPMGTVVEVNFEAVE